MPVLDSTQPEATDAPLGRIPAAAEPQDDQQPPTSFLEAADAAFRTGTTHNVLSRMLGPAVPSEVEPGYNYEDHIPAGMPDEYAARYVNTDNSAQAARLTGEIKNEMAANQVIARAGPIKGTVASLAVGFTDPLNLLASAIVPEAAPTRAGNALRWALTNAASSTGIEAIRAEADQSFTPGQGLFNIGAGALLGGLLGPMASRVPKKAFEGLANDFGSSVREAPKAVPVAAPGEGIDLGKIQATPDSLLPQRSSLEAATQGPIEPGAELEIPKRYTPPAPEGPSTPRPGFMPLIEPHKMSLSEAIAVTQTEGAKAHGLSYNEAIAQGLDPADLDAARFGGRRVFTKGGASFDEMAEALHQHGYPVQDEQGNYSPNALLESLDRELRGRKQYSPAAEDYLSALAEHEQAQAHPEEPRSPYESDLERDARMLESKQHENALPGEPTYVPEELREYPKTPVNPEEASTMGAAAAQGVTKADLTTGRGAQAYNATIGRVSVGGRLIRASSLEARKLLTSLANIPGTLEGNYRDVANPNPIERILWKEVEGRSATNRVMRRDLFRQYRDRVRQGGETPLGRWAFNEEIAKAMRRGDKHAIPEVAEAAKRSRATAFQPYWERAIKAGAVSEEAKSADIHAESYLTRIYDANKIKADPVTWMQRLRDGFIQKHGVDPAEANDIADKVHRNIMAGERATMDWHATDGIVPKSGRLQGRTLALPDEWLEDFLSNDIDHIEHSYLRSIVPEVEMTERFGDRNLSDALSKVGDDYGRLRAQAGDDKGKFNALTEESKAVRQQLEAIRDRLYGIYGAPKDAGNWAVRTGRFIRFANVERLLGGATFSHFPDFGNIVTRYGMPQTIAAMAKLATSLNGMTLALRSAQRMGAAIDMVMNMVAPLLGDYAGGGHSPFLEQRIGARASRFLTKITGETPLITFTQAVTSALAQHEILTMAARVASGRELNSNVAARLAAGGLDQAMLQRISEAAQQHTRVFRGLKFGLSDAWADQGAAAAFESAVAREAHGVTLRPGVADTPLMMSTEWGKFIFQFKTFEYAASRIVGTQALQAAAHGDVRAAEAMLGLTAMGLLSYATKQKISGQPMETNPAKLALEIADKSNLLGWTSDVIFPSLYVAGFKGLSRFQDKDPFQTAIGPSADIVEGIFNNQIPGRIANLVSGGNVPGQQNIPFRRSDLHFMRRMAPGQNLWYFRRGVDAMEDGVGDLFDLPGKSNADRQLEETFAP